MNSALPAAWYWLASAGRGISSLYLFIETIRHRCAVGCPVAVVVRLRCCVIVVVVLFRLVVIAVVRLCCCFSVGFYRCGEMFMYVARPVRSFSLGYYVKKL